jgi:hypothetical protein
MKEEIARIMRLVQEGKLSPEDAAELIDAFQTGEAQDHAVPPEPPRPEPPREEPTWTGDHGTPPPTPPHEPKESEEPRGPFEPKDPFRSFIDTMENLGKEVSQNVNWHEVARQIREGAKKGVEELKVGLTDLKSGKVGIGWFSAYDTKDVTLPLGDATAKTLRVENPCGDVKISGGFSESSVSARARIRGATPEEAVAKASDYTVIVEESDHEIVIRQPDVTGLEVDLVIQLTRANHVDVKTSRGDVDVLDTGGGAKVSNASGDIDLRGLNGAIEVNTQNGDLRIDDCTTPALAIENKTGDIHVTNVTGNINARSASGDVHMDDVAGKAISVESVNGDVKVHIVQPVSGSVNIRTVNGDAELRLPLDSHCRVSLSTLRGDVNCQVVLAEEARLEQRITGRLGDGSGSVDVSAVNGDVTLGE